MTSVASENGKKVLTMAEYIEREDVIEEIMSEPPDAHYPHWYADKIKSIPAADVARVRHGRWVEKEKYTFGIMYDCSLCENRILDNGHSWNYCPNCGAQMDGGGGNSDMA